MIADHFLIKLGQTDIIDFFIDPTTAMALQNRNADPRLQAAVAVAFVLYCTVQTVIKTFLADMSVTVKSCRGTYQAKVMNRLHHRNFAFQCGVIDGRTDQRQCIVNMHDVDMLFANDLLYIPISLSVENCTEGKHELLKKGKPIDLAVASRIEYNFVPVIFQQFFLVGNNGLFSPGDFIKIMNKQDFRFLFHYFFRIIAFQINFGLE